MKKSKVPAPKPAAPVPAATRKFKTWHYACAVLLAIFVLFQVYGPALNGPFVYDDPYLPFAAPGFEDRTIKEVVLTVRPLLMLSFWLNLHISGDQPYGYHLWNVVLHSITGFFVFLIVLKLLRRVDQDRQRTFMLACFASGVFLLHPLQTESVAYIASRSEALSVFFAYAALAVFLTQPPEGISWVRSFSVLILFGCAALTKEHTAVLPAVLVAIDYYWHPGFSIRGILRNWRLYAPMALAAAAGLSFVLWVLRGSDTAGFGMKNLQWYEYFFTQCRAIWVYLRLFLLPYGLNIDHDFPLSHSITDHGAIFGLIGLVALLAAAWIYRKQYPLASFGVVLFLMLLAPTSSFVPIRDTLVERRFYLPSIGLLLVLVDILRRIELPKARLAPALAAVLIVLGVLTHHRNRLWGDSLLLWGDAVAKSPNKARPHSQLAFALQRANRCADALPHYEKASQLAKSDPRNLINWALALDCVGRQDEAIAKLKQALALEETGHIYSLIGMIYGKQGLLKESLEALDTAVRLEPLNDMAYVYRGNVYVSSNEIQKAIAEYRHALAINPRNEVARMTLMRIGATTRQQKQ